MQEIQEKIKEAFKRISLKNLELMRKTPYRPDEIGYFEKIISTDIREKELEGFPGKIIGTFCNFVPEELIYAAGAIPIRLCMGFYDTISFAEEVLPRDICPLVKSSFGCIKTKFSYFSLCDLIILPTPCDPKKKLGEILSDYLPVLVLKIPQDKDINSSRDIWLKEIKTLKEKIEDFTANKITKEKLKDAIKLLHKRQAVFRKLYQLKTHNPSRINGRDTLIVIQTSFFDDIKRWTEHAQKLCDQLNKELPPSPRILLTGSPLVWPNFKILHIIEELGAIVVIDELCSGTRYLYDPVEVEEWTTEGMLRAIANRYLLPSTCPCFVQNTDRRDRLLQMVKDFKIDGVIHHSLRLCQVYDMELNKISSMFKENSIPFLNIYTDYSLEDTEQIRTRIEAFLEMLR